MYIATATMFDPFLCKRRIEIVGTSISDIDKCVQKNSLCFEYVLEDCRTIMTECAKHLIQRYDDIVFTEGARTILNKI